MSQIYEGMFLLDNDLVREGWDGAKRTVTAALEKHGGKVHTARRWDERRLAYPIRRKQRATYLLTYYEIPGDAIPAMRREFDLSERVLRYLMLAVDEIPKGEAELAAAESSADFIVPEPPADDVAEEPEAEDADEARAEKKSEDDEDDEDDEADLGSEADASAKTKSKTETKAGAKAADAPAADAGSEENEEG